MALKEYNYEYDEGRIVRATESEIVLNDSQIVIGKTVVNTIRYRYDAEGNMTKKSVISSDNSVNTTYYETTDDNTVVKFDVPDPTPTAPDREKTILSHSKSDSFGRKEFDEIQLGSGFVSRQFSYHAGKVTDEHKQNGKLKSSPTTNLVSGIVLSNGTTLTYAYDAEEHITSVTETYDVDGVPVVKVTSYTYDALGQLKTETSNGITTKFEYDNYGNITAKGVATENGDIIPETKIEYTYDSVWKDKLISFNGQEIVYDTQGNPTEYLGHNLTWEKGRQLKFFDNDSYTYNANGIRTSKTVNGCELHEYVLEGSKILKESWNGNNLIPLYDNTDSVCGIIYNNISYFFLKNLQGDIIAITNGERDTVARYSYDAWGKCTVTQDTTIQRISTINPFRYRGYYLDDKTGLYYLNSRYYDPNTGRFINSDSPEYVSFKGGNLFTYCGNCPTKNADYFGFCYVPTYPESYIPTTYYSYGNKKKKDGLIKTLLKVLGGIVGIVSVFAAAIIIDIREFLNKNPWIEETLSIITLFLYVAAIFVLCISASGVVASIILGAAAVAKTIDNIITVVTFDPKSIPDYISLIISLIIPKVVTKGFAALSKLKITEKVRKILSNEKIKDFVSDAILKIYDIFS